MASLNVESVAQAGRIKREPGSPSTTHPPHSQNFSSSMARPFVVIYIRHCIGCLQDTGCFVNIGRWGDKGCLVDIGQWGNIGCLGEVGCSVTSFV